jgi:hypothetical protein
MRQSLAAIYSLLCFCGPAFSQEKTEPIEYDLKVRMEPAQGSVSVSGTIEIPGADRSPEGFTFALHETFVIRKLLICGNEVKYSVVAKEPGPIQPASHGLSQTGAGIAGGCAVVGYCAVCRRSLCLCCVLFQGRLMLDQLTRTPGNDQFFRACREFFELYTKKFIGTEQFRSFWETQLRERKKLVDGLLDAKGSLPNLGSGNCLVLAHATAKPTQAGRIRAAAASIMMAKACASVDVFCECGQRAAVVLTIWID